MEYLVSSDRPNMDSGYPSTSVLPDETMSHHDPVEILEHRVKAEFWPNSLDVEVISRSLEKLFKKLYVQRRRGLGYFEDLLRQSLGEFLRDKYKGGTSSEYNSERLVERKKFFDNLESVELKDFELKMYRVLHFIVVGSTSRSGEFINLSVSEEFRLLILDAVYCRDWEEVESLIMPIAAAFCCKSAVNHAVIIGAALLLSVVYLHLIALVDRGGGKIYSSGSLEFRSIYISILLFLGAHVWIKSRDLAPPSQQKPSPGLHRKCKVNGSGVKVYCGNFEPRFKPPGSENYISVGSYELEEDAKNMYRILAFYYDKHDGALTLKDGNMFFVPPMTEEEQRRFSGPDLEEKKNCVKEKAKAVYEEYILTGSSDWGSQQDRGMPAGSNQAVDGLESVPSGCIPEVGPVTQWTQHHIANDTLSGRLGDDASHLTLPESTMPETVTSIPAPVSATGAGARLPGEQPLEPQLQQESLQENQANNSSINVTPDVLSLILRQLRELQGQQQLQQSRLQQEEARSQQLESRLQQEEARSQQLESRLQQEEARSQQLEARSQQLEARSQQLEARSQQLEARSQQLEARSQQLEARSQQLEARSQQLEARSQQLEARSQQLEARSQQLEARSQQLEARSQQLEARSQQLEARSQQLEARSQQLEARSQQLEARSQQLEARSQQLEARSQQLEARSQQLEARSQQLEARSQQLEARSQQLEARSQQLEARSQQLEARSQQLESRLQQLEARSQQQESRFRQQESRFQQESWLQQLESRISELQDEVERLRSTEPARKRSCTSLTLRRL